jgi:serine/threonine protein kinase
VESKGSRSTMSLPVALTPGTLIGGHYITGDLINQGGFGGVYRGVDTSEGNRPCAIKETYDVTPAARRQALMEASVLFTVRSPHLPAVYDAFEANGRFYLVMQLIAGNNLLQLLRTRVPNGQVGMQAPGQLTTGPCSEQEVLSWLLPLMDVLQELHSRRPPVMHRDIKPGNIVLTPNNTAVLLDFGLTKLYDPNVSTQTLGRAVTEGFSPLEQYIGKTSPQSDIYSMGATFYLLWTNRLPPTATSRGARDELIAPHLLNPSLSPKLEWILLKALALHADQRFESMGEFARALREPAFIEYNEPTVSVAFNQANSSKNPSQVVLPGYTGNAYPVVPGSAPFRVGPDSANDAHTVAVTPGYNQGPYPFISPQQSYGPGMYGQQQANYPGNGAQAPLAAYPYVPPGGASALPAKQNKGTRTQSVSRRPLPMPADQGCLWGVLQGVLAAALVLFVKEQAVFYLATLLGLLFYALAGYMTTRRGGNPLRGGRAGYWTGIFGTITFWVGLLIGLLVSALQRFQMFTRYNTSPNASLLFPQAWRDVQPQWPAIPQIIATQPPLVNFLLLMLIGLVAAWIAGWLGGLGGSTHYVSRKPAGP